MMSRTTPSVIFLLMLGAVFPLHAAITPRLTNSTSAPSTIGTVVRWTVEASDTNPGPLWYRFRARTVNGTFATVRDFSPANTLDWTAIDAEGIYVIEASVFNQRTGEIVYTSAPVEIVSRATGETPVINPTDNPLVFLYSAPPCELGGIMRVYFWTPERPTQATQTRSCNGTSSMNFYIAGMQANTSYEVEHFIFRDRQWTTGPILPLTTGSLPNSIGGRPFPKQTVLLGSSIQYHSNPFLLQGPLNAPPFVTDLNGNIVWYYPEALTFLTGPDRDGLFFGIRNSGGDSSGSVLRLFDVGGTTIKETNAGALNLQLAALGKRQIGVLHHAATRLSNGNIVTLATVEQMMTDVQGPGAIDVIGDMIIVLDSDLQVLWTWDAFDHLDVARTAIMNETCMRNGGCMSHFLAPDGNDWTHSNSVSETPDGNLVLSIRHLDWVVKINYENGTGDGRVIWRLGREGDFTFEPGSDDRWFSHQHDASFLSDNATLTLFDNGNLVKASDASATSRGQVLLVDEARRTVKSVLSQDLGVFSQAVGSAQKLLNGNYHFDAGFVNNSRSISFEVDGSGRIVCALQADAMEYRTYRLVDLYTGLEQPK